MTEIHKKIDLRIGQISDKRMTWEDAKAYAEAQGMRLPTRSEFLVMIEQGIKLPGWCWTCEEFSAVTAWIVGCAGFVRDGYKYGGSYAVPVAALD